MLVMLLAPRGLNMVNLIKLQSYLIISYILIGGTRALKNTELIKEIQLVFCCNIIGGRQNGKKQNKTNTNKQTN